MGYKVVDHLFGRLACLVMSLPFLFSGGKMLPFHENISK